VERFEDHAVGYVAIIIIAGFDVLIVQVFILHADKATTLRLDKASSHMIEDTSQILAAIDFASRDTTTPSVDHHGQSAIHEIQWKLFAIRWKLHVQPRLYCKTCEVKLTLYQSKQC